MVRSVLVLSICAAAQLLHASPVSLLVDLDLDTDQPRLYVLDAGGESLVSYPIAAPKKTPQCLLMSDVTGTVEKVDRHAYWFPTYRTKEYSRIVRGRTLKDVYGPTDPGNALGGRKLVVEWGSTCLQSTVRIHATNDPSYVVKQARVSRNCIRLTKEDWDDLSTYVAPGTPVTVTADWK